MDDLLNSNRDFDGVIKRNIVSLRRSEDLFDDLTDGDATLTRLAQSLEANVKQLIPTGIIARSFHYTTAVEYPFVREPYLMSRYGNGSHPVWYGALDLETTIHETCYHMVREERRIEGHHETIYRERAVYDVDGRAILIDLVGKEQHYPALIEESYHFTQPLGQRMYDEGHPGLIAPSARHRGGENAIIFRQNMLTNPRVTCYLNYLYSATDNTVIVERTSGETLITLRYPR